MRGKTVGNRFIGMAVVLVFLCQVMLVTPGFAQLLRTNGFPAPGKPKTSTPQDVTTPPDPSALVLPSNTIGFASAAVCPAVSTPIYSGTNPGVAGAWWNPKRYNTGWEINYSSTGFYATWNTFDGHGRPTWLLSDPGNQKTSGPNQYWQPLYSTQIDPNTGVLNQTYVGQVAITFLSNAPTLAAVRWQWNAYGPNPEPVDECIENFFLESSIPPGTVNSVASTDIIDESWNSSWSAPTQSGWGVSMTVGRTNGTLAENDIAHIYDMAGNPIWILGSAANTHTDTEVTAAQELIPLYFVGAGPGYPQGFPTSDCVSGQASACGTYILNVGQWKRWFDTETTGYSVLTASVPASANGAAITWPIPAFPNPATGGEPIARLTDLSQLQVSQTECTVVTGTTCVIRVSWISSDAGATVRRYNFYTKQLSAPLTANSQDEYYDTLNVGDDVQYVMYPSNTPSPIYGTTASLFVSPEVKILQAPVTPVAPVLASNPGEDANSTTVGALAGQFSVDGGGNAQYRVPIYTPRGAGGLTPGLALTYSSGAGDGPFGIGWQLEGLSSISICRKTQEHGDGVGVSGVAETNPLKSVYCLDGERLVLVSGTNGAQGAVYRLENDSFSKIVIQTASTVNGPTQSTYLVPTVFTVYGKDGTIRHYGGSGAQLTWQATANAAAYTKSWFQYDVQDTNGNTVNFSYTGTSSPASLLINAITYSGGRIDFGNSQIPRGYAGMLSYQGGIAVSQTAWIGNITVSGANSTVLKNYSLGYTNLVNNPGLKQLTSLTECTDITKATCYAPLSFMWADMSAWTASAGPSTPNPGTSVTSASSNQSFFNAQPGSMRFGDINGDGRADAVWVHEDRYGTSTHGSFHIGFGGESHSTDLGAPNASTFAKGGFASFINTDDPCGGDNSTNANSPNSACPQEDKFLDFAKSFQLIDFDGDGKDDLMMLEPTSNVDNGPTDFRFVIWLSDGSTFKTKITNIVSSGTTAGPMPLTKDAANQGSKHSHSGGLTIADLDGDGIPDAFVLNDVSATVWLLKPHVCAAGESPCYRYMFQGPYNVAFGTPGNPVTCRVGDFTSQQFRVSDFNGDGRADLLLLQPNGACHSTNDPSPPAVSATLEHMQIFNSSGVHDATNFYFTPGYSWQQENQSDGSCAGGTSYCYANSSVFQVADINGDGLPDVAFATYYAPGGPSSVNPPPAQTPNQPVVPTPYVPEDPNSADGTDQQAGWVYQLNTGDGAFSTTTCVVVNSTNNGCANVPGPFEVEFGDYDGDGKADFLVPNWRNSTTCANYFAYLWVGAPATGGSGFSATPICTPFMSPDIGSGSHVLFSYMADLDGDGYSDQLLMDPWDDSVQFPDSNGIPGSFSKGRWQARRTTSHHQPRNVITQVKSGLGAVTQVTYAPMSYSSVYYREYNGYTLQSGWGSPVQDAFAPSYVVEYAKSSAPSATDPNDPLTGPTGVSAVRYQYAGMKVQGGGRGSLGFHKVYSTDMQTGIETVTTYNQAFPLTGTPAETTAYDLRPGLATFDTLCDPNYGGDPDSSQCMSVYPYADVSQAAQHILSDTIDTWTSIPVISATSPAPTTPTPIFVYRSDSKQRKYDLAPSSWAYSDGSGPANAPHGASTASVGKIPRISPSPDNGTLPHGPPGGVNGVPLSAQQTFFTYNIAQGELTSYGELTDSSTTDYAEVDDTFVVSSPIRTTTTHQEYGGDVPGNWFIGRLSKSTTTVSVASAGADDNLAGAPITRTSTFSYDPITGQLMVEHLQPLGSNDQAVDKFHFHDAAGNEIQTVTCSATATAAAACSSAASGKFSATHLPQFAPSGDIDWVQRYSRTVFDSSSIYPTETDTAFSNGTATGASEHRTAYGIVRDGFGNITDAYDVHGVESKSYYNKLGRAYFSANSLGGASMLTYRWCTGSAPAGTTTIKLCPSGAVYRLDTTNNTGATSNGAATTRAPETWVYYDMLGRDIVQVKQGFNAGDYIAIRKDYDNLGRVSHVTEPYFTTSPESAGFTASGLSTTYSTTTEYDALGRVVAVTPPNGQATLTLYTDLTTEVILPPNVSQQTEDKITTQNHLGQVVEIFDTAIQTTLINTYDASGHVVSVYRGGADGKAATVTMGYDALGRKTSMNDPDLGAWTYTYNPVGELLTQSSGTTCSKSQYDGQGRVITKQDFRNTGCTGTPEINASWHYDTTAYGLGQLTQSYATDNGVGTTRTPTYDSYGRVSQVLTQIGTLSYIDTSTYDQFGRPFQSFFASPPSTGTVLQVFAETGELYSYNAQGYAYQIQDAERGLSGHVYRQITAMDARGNVTNEIHAGVNTLTTQHTYDPAMGWLTAISTPGIQNLTYSYDNLGNQQTRTDNSPGGAAINESFGYDALQRLVNQTQIRTAAQGGNITTNFNYDSFGNPSGGSYGSGALLAGQTNNCKATTPAVEVVPGPDAITSNTVNSTVLQYCYDARGNQTRILSGTTATQTNTYTSDDKLRNVQTQNSYITHTSGFAYGAERQRVQRIDYGSSAGSGVTTTQYVGNAEIILPPGAATPPTLKRYLPGLILSITGNVISYEYLFTDNLGSTHRITDQTGTPASSASGGQQSFTAFGQRADLVGNVSPTNSAFNFVDTLTHHGFTGQEQLDESGLIHMNGRVYSPGTMRFTSPDPFVQAPNDMQSYNRYSYVMNNPLTHTDPSGYWGHRQQGYLREVAAIAIAVVTQDYAYAALQTGAEAEAAGIVVAGGSAAGFVQTGNLKGAVLGGIEAGIDFGITNGIPFSGSNANPGGNIAAHAVSGGVLEVLRGGKFGHGFVVAGLQAAITPRLNSDNAFVNGVSAAIIGGSISQVTGGKFANGAISGAFQAAFGAIASRGGSGPLESRAVGSSDLSDVPTDELRREMVSSDPADRLDAAQQAIIYFDIKGSGYNLTYSDHVMSGGTAAETYTNGEVRLYDGAFSSWSQLGSTLGHEIEVHWNLQVTLHGGPFSDQDRYMREYQAYGYELGNVSRFGSSRSEIQNMNYMQGSYYGRLDSAHQQLVNKGIYYAPGW